MGSRYFFIALYCWLEKYFSRGDYKKRTLIGPSGPHLPRPLPPSPMPRERSEPCCTIRIRFMKALLEVLRPGEADWELAQAIDPTRLPEHIAIIMDGNGRWAGRRRLPRVAGHKAGIGPVRITVETCARLGVKALTLYAFSIENWKRPRHEVETLWRLLRYYLRQELPDLQKNDIRLQAIGRVDALPAQVRRELESAVEATSANRGLLVNLAINYGGRAEIVDAVNAVLEMARLDGSIQTLKLDEDLIATNLYTADCPDPDLLIRTSGEMRISNFLLWQIAYAELYVTETLWPDFTRTDLLQAVLEYQKRDRRYGGLSAGAGERRLRAQAASGGRRLHRSAALVMKRVLTAAALIPIICYVVLWAAQPVFLAVLAAAACLTWREYRAIALERGAQGDLSWLQPARLWRRPALLLTASGNWWLIVLPLASVALCWSMRAADLADTLPRAAVLVFGVTLRFRRLVVRHSAARRPTRTG